MRYTGHWGFEIIMNNIPEIQTKLARLRDSNEIQQMLDTTPKTLLLKEDIKATLSNACFALINKLIKHLDSKRPNKSSITNVIFIFVQKLQNTGIAENGLNYFLVMVTEIINSTFEGAFSNRLNVKSQEFLDLEDCEPF